MRYLAVLLTCLLVACASTPEPTKVGIGLMAASDANLYKNKPTGPVTVRLYELKAASSFERADYFTLFESDEKTLGSDLLAKEEYKLQLGETIPVKEKALKPDTRLIGAFAQFNDIENTQWRALLSIPEAKKRLWLFTSTPSLWVKVEQRKITIQAQ